MEWPWDDELAFRVRRSKEAVVQRGIRKLRRDGALKGLDRGEAPDSDAQDPTEEAIENFQRVLDTLAHPKVLAHVLLTDWRGVFDEDGEPAPFDPDAAEEVLSDPDYTHLREWIADMAVQDRNYRKEARDEGNSSPPASSGSSGGGGKSKKTKASKG